MKKKEQLPPEPRLTQLSTLFALLAINGGEGPEVAFSRALDADDILHDKSGASIGDLWEIKGMWDRG